MNCQLETQIKVLRVWPSRPMRRVAIPSYPPSWTPGRPQVDCQTSLPCRCAATRATCGWVEWTRSTTPPVSSMCPLCSPVACTKYTGPIFNGAPTPRRLLPPLAIMPPNLAISVETQPPIARSWIPARRCGPCRRRCTIRSSTRLETMPLLQLRLVVPRSSQDLV